MLKLKPSIPLMSKNSSKMDIFTEDDEEGSLLVKLKDLVIPSIGLLTISLCFDSFYSRLGVSFLAGLLLPQFWIMNFALVTFLLATGVVWFYIQEYMKKEILSYFVRRRTLNFSLKNALDVIIK